MTWRVTYSLRSQRDLEQIRTYLLQESGSEDIAARFLRQLLDECDALGTLPQRFPPYPYAPRWRMMPVGNYLVFFRVEIDAVWIGHVRHAAKRPFGA